MKTTCVVILLLLSLLPLIAVNRGASFISSATLPGSGQLLNGSKYGYAMIGAELGIWATIFYLSNEQNLSETKYEDYAIRFAGIQPGNHPSQYYSDISRYDSSGFEAGGYNAMIRQQARQNFPDDLAAQQAYIETNIYSDDLAWNWDSISNRREYNSIRIYNKNLKDYSKIATGLLLLNHLISTIDILRYPLGEESRVSFGFNSDRTMLLMDVKF